MTAAWNVPRHLALIALAGWTSAGPLSAAANSGTAGTAPPATATKGTGSSVETPRKITLDFVEAEIADIAKALSVQSGVNIACSANTKGKITLRLHGVTLDEALRFVSRLAGLDFRRVGDTYVIGNPDELRSLVARSGVTDIWVPKHLSLAEAKSMVQSALPFVTVQGQEAGKRILLVGTAEDVAAARTFLNAADVATEAPRVVEVAAPAEPVIPRVTRVYQLQYLEATSAQKLFEVGKEEKDTDPVIVKVAPDPFTPRAAEFKPLSTETLAIGNAAEGKAKESSGKESRALILSGRADKVEAAVALLKSVDVAPPQVLIEARLVEVSPEKFKDLGLKWEFLPSGIQEMRTPRGTASAPDLGDHGMSFGRFIRTPLDFIATLNALQENRTARLLANPRVSVIDGEDASVFIGDLLRFRVLQSVTVGGSEQFTIKEVPVGIALLVRPRVHEDGNVTLKVHPVVSTVTSFVGPEKIPQTATREADSTIRMKDGETVVIGGLMREEDITVMSKVPGLGNLPLIGKLFSNKNTSKKKSEVTVFLTARILK